MKGKKNYRKKPTIRQGYTSDRHQEDIRLNRFIAMSGVCSRRDADNLILKGQVTVNGIRVKELGTRVRWDDDVRLRGKKLAPEKKIYILLNKPKDVITTADDPEGRRTVLDLIKLKSGERIFPVGRLDRASTGILLLTNDGDLAARLTHPKYNQSKIYHVVLDKPLTQIDLEKMLTGINLDGEVIKIDEIEYIDPADKSQLGIQLHSGKYRVIRRIMASLGYKVKKLDRVYFAGLTKKNLPRGKWRFLESREVAMLYASTSRQVKKTK